jgi:LacI family transcriptional regulator
VAIIGHDDLPFCSVTFPGISTICQPLDDLGEEAVRLLIDRIRDRQRPTRQVVLNVDFVERETTVRATQKA